MLITNSVFFGTSNPPKLPLIARRALLSNCDQKLTVYRQDMLGDIREELKILTGVKSGRHKGLTVANLSMVGLNMGEDRKRVPWGVVLARPNGLSQLGKKSESKRLEFLKNNHHILSHRSMACLLVDNEPIAFPAIHRNEVELAKIPAKITIQFADDSTLSNALSRMKTSDNIKLVQLDTAVFAFEPFLKRLQEITELPLKEEIIHWGEGIEAQPPSFKPTRVLRNVEAHTGKDLKTLLNLQKSVVLDGSQMDSLCTCLGQRVSLVQGPPGQSRISSNAVITTD